MSPRRVDSITDQSLPPAELLPTEPVVQSKKPRMEYPEKAKAGKAAVNRRIDFTRPPINFSVYNRFPSHEFESMTSKALDILEDDNATIVGLNSSLGLSFTQRCGEIAWERDQ